MDTGAIPILAAAGLGIATALHPCPLAGNVAVVSWLSRWAGEPRATLIAASAYTLGRIFGYGSVAVLLSLGLLSTTSTVQVLQGTAYKLLGPALIVAGMMVAGLLPVSLKRKHPSAPYNFTRTARGAFLLGFVLSVSFCPASAALFFGALIPMALNEGRPVLLPVVYAVSTAIPVICVAVSLNSGLRYTSAKFWRTEAFERWLPRVTGGILILIGIYMSFQRVFIQFVY